MCGLACRGGGGGIRLEDIQAGKKGYRSFVRSFVSNCNAVKNRLSDYLFLVLLISESQGEMSVVTSLQRLFGSWNQKSFLALLRS